MRVTGFIKLVFALGNKFMCQLSNKNKDMGTTSYPESLKVFIEGLMCLETTETPTNQHKEQEHN